MVEVTSRGVVTPSGLRFLVDEGILPQDPAPSLYQWKCYQDRDQGLGEELLYTRDCVVYCKDGYVHRVFRHDNNIGDVRFAEVTTFSGNSAASQAHTARLAASAADDTAGHGLDVASFGRRRQSSRPAAAAAQSSPTRLDGAPRVDEGSTARAVAVFVGRQCHIHFLKGTTHIVNVPIDVAHVFPSYCGLVVQRRTIARPRTSGAVPAPPMNSFRTVPLASSFSPSAKTAHGMGALDDAFGRLLGPGRNSLNDNFMDTANDMDETNLPRFLFLSDPFSEFSALASATIASLPRHLRSSETDLLIEYDDFDDSETVLYTSSCDELATGPSAGNVVPLLILVTLNEDLGQITVWQGWQIKRKPLPILTAARSEVKAARARRRSSLTSVPHIGPALTPSVRFHDRGRESFAVNAHLPDKRDPKKKRKSKPVRTTAEEDAAAMASRMDPDNLFARAQPIGPRRAGSTLARGDLSAPEQNRQTGKRQSQAASKRRGPSFRASYDRKSLGTSIYRKSRGSVRGSVFSRSVTTQVDDSIDLDGDSFMQTDLDDELSRAAELYIATNDFASIDPAFTGGSEGAKPDFVVRKVHVLPVGNRIASDDEVQEQPRFKVRSSLAVSTRSSEPAVLALFVHDRSHRKTIVPRFRVGLSPVIDNPEQRTQSILHLGQVTLPVPMFQSQETLPSINDIAKLDGSDSSTVVLLTNDRHLKIAPSDSLPWTVSLPSRVRAFDASDVSTHLSQGLRDTGISRTLELMSSVERLKEDAALNLLSVQCMDGHTHRMHLYLRPENELVKRVLEVVCAVLPARASLMVPKLWATACQSLQKEMGRLGSKDDLELEAAAITLLAYAAGSLGRPPTRRARARHSLPVMPTSEQFPMSDASSKSSSINECWADLCDNAMTQTPPSSPPRKTESTQSSRSASFNDVEAKARAILHELSNDVDWLLGSDDMHARTVYALQILLSAQIFLEEFKLSSSLSDSTRSGCVMLAAALAQLGHYLGLPAWSWEQQTELTSDFGFVDWDFSNSIIPDTSVISRYQAMKPFSAQTWFLNALQDGKPAPLVLLDHVANVDVARPSRESTPLRPDLLPTLMALDRFLSALPHCTAVVSVVEAMHRSGLTKTTIDALPEGMTAIFYDHIAKCQSQPPSTWSPSLLRLIGREDLEMPNHHHHQMVAAAIQAGLASNHDVQAITTVAERPLQIIKSNAMDRNATASQLFADDRRLLDASTLLNPSALQVAECPSRSEWTEVEHLEQQKKTMAWVMTRTISLSAGYGLFLFESQKPLLSEKFHVPGYSMQCQMKPMDNTISADRTGFTEEKLSWAFFHAGTSAGLRISRKASGIDTSWIVFNKPQDLTNRHAGLLLALGLNGHLRNMAKWLAFKYLTPKHTMTSVGLLLGLAASHMGTMDTLITRMLSVHITRMLPPGAAELNVSPLTQTAGLVGIGLLYHNTQHRRMSEIMLSELEHREIEEAGSAADLLRDESYRLAAGFALGLMNLGKGDNLQGLQGMALLERLLSIAVGSRPVELVHVIDKATAGSILAMMLIYIKTGDGSIASKINVPTTLSQLDHVRPDILLLRTVAKDLIMWDDIRAESGWIRSQLPAYCAYLFPSKSSTLIPILKLRSADIPIFNIIAGHAWSLSMRFAGTASTIARDEILTYLDAFWTCAQHEADFYDAQLTRTTLRRCIDLLALSAATVMAGTGDLTTFRYLRRLHGRVDAATTYGSHMAAHLAIGALFLGGGTYTFSTSNLAIAALLISFYPLFPGDVLDHAVHLQALRHLWVLAAENRCMVCMDIDTGRPTSMPLRLVLRTGETRNISAPCLLPDFDTIASIETTDTTYRKARLDLSTSKSQLARFRADPIVYVRKAPATEASPLIFSQVLAAMNEKQNMPSWFAMWSWLLQFPAVQSCVDATELDLVIPLSEGSASHLDERGTVLDSRLSLWRDAGSTDVQRLWNVRLLLVWAEKKRLEEDGRLKWLGDEFVGRLEAVVEREMADMYGDEMAD